MNKHIELVKKWLDNPDSVTQQELEDNRDAVYDADADYWVKRYEELKEQWEVSENKVAFILDLIMGVIFILVVTGLCLGFYYGAKQ